MINSGMFYLRYTTGDPLENLRRRAAEGVSQYVHAYAGELARLEFEPEREFETVVAGENLLISGAIDVVRLEDPPRITILDFKSGDSEEEVGSGLTKELMSLQIGVYGLAARHELEYEPQRGIVRYIGERDAEKRELPVNLGDAELAAVRQRIVATGRRIRERRFHEGPSGLIPDRCGRCDFSAVFADDRRRSRHDVATRKTPLMTDKIAPGARSKIMAATRGRSTASERAVRRTLFAQKYRYRLVGRC
jgi:DNA helicase-2/ATP-dependent DNA helicase PcrA